MNKRICYFVKQKLLGVALTILALVSPIILDGDITVAIVLAPMGIGLTCTKEMVYMNNYFFEVEEIKEQERMES